MPFRKNKLVCVEWEDACHNSGFYDKHHRQDSDPVIARTVGYIAEYNKRCIKVCAETFTDGGLRHINTIPVKMVRKIRELREVNDAREDY